MKNNLNLSDNIINSLKNMYGELPEHIGITKMPTPDIIELGIKFYSQRRTPNKTVYANNNDANACGVMQICDNIEKLVYNKLPNVDDPKFEQEVNIKFHVSSNVPDGIIHISPKTYYEMFSKIDK